MIQVVFKDILFQYQIISNYLWNNTKQCKLNDAIIGMNFLLKTSRNDSNVLFFQWTETNWTKIDRLFGEFIFGTLIDIS